MKDFYRLEADRVKLLDKHITRGRGGSRIEMVVIHHNAGVLSIDQIWQVWQNREASAHYQVTSSGEVGQLVWDSNTAWHAANASINRRSIGIEISNSGGAAQGWPIADAAIVQGARLAAAVCHHYKLGVPTPGKNLRWHREFTSTTCPGQLAPGGTYHRRFVDEAQRFYGALKQRAVTPTGQPIGQEAANTMVERVLSYPRDQVHQDTYYNCGPASTQTIVRAATGKLIGEHDLGAQLRTHKGGTDWIGQFPAVLNRLIPGADYTHVEMPHDPPNRAQKDRLWADITASIDAGHGVVANICAPPSNYPRAVAPSTISPSYGGGTVWHYIAVMGYSTHGQKKVWVADSGFRPYGYWLAFDQLATLIPPKGYAYSRAGRATAPAAKPNPPTPKKENPMSLSTVVQTAVDGSDFRDTLANFIRYADANAFVAKKNSEALMAMLERVDARLTAIETTLNEGDKEGRHAA